MEWDERKSKRLLAGEPTDGPAFPGRCSWRTPIDRPGPLPMRECPVHPRPPAFHVNIDARLRPDRRDEVPLLGPTAPLSARECPKSAEKLPAGSAHQEDAATGGHGPKDNRDHRGGKPTAWGGKLSVLSRGSSKTQAFHRASRGSPRGRRTQRRPEFPHRLGERSRPGR